VVVTALIALFLAFDSIIHILEIDASVESFAELGYPEGSAVAIGVLELACLALYVIPRTAVLGTAVLGAVLLTGYLGGAVSAHVRIESPLSSTTLFPVYSAWRCGWGCTCVTRASARSWPAEVPAERLHRRGDLVPAARGR
jgi:hypothetical protein